MYLSRLGENSVHQLSSFPSTIQWMYFAAHQQFHPTAPEFKSVCDTKSWVHMYVSMTRVRRSVNPEHG